MTFRLRQWCLIAAVLFLPGAFLSVFFPLALRADDFSADSEKLLKMIVQGKDTRRAFRQIQAASRKSPEAMFAMYQILSYGALRQEYDREKALKFLERAAKQNFFPALLYVIRHSYQEENTVINKKMFSLCKENGMLSLYARSLRKKDPREQKKLFAKLRRNAARDGDSAAVIAYCTLRGIIDDEGEGVVPMLETVLKKRPNHGDCLYILARCYETGIGTEKDPEKAEMYFQRALKACCPQAIYHLFAATGNYPLAFSRTRGDRVPESFIDEYPFYSFHPEFLQYHYLFEEQAKRKEFQKLTPKHVEVIGKLAEKGCVSMIALQYEIYKHGLGIGKPDPETAEKCFEKRKNTCLLHRLYNVLCGGSYSRSSQWRESCFEFKDRRGTWRSPVRHVITSREGDVDPKRNTGAETNGQSFPQPIVDPKRNTGAETNGQSFPQPIVEPEDADESEL